jgi:hypothetical protein
MKLIGFILILIGFALPFALTALFPTIFTLPLSFWFFAMGFLLILRPFKNDIRLNSYLKWASYGIWANIILVIILVFYFSSIADGIIRRGVVVNTMHTLRVLANPISAIIDGLFPRPTLQLDDGVLTTYWFPRELLTTFFDLVFYAAIGVLLKMCKDRKITF